MAYDANAESWVGKFDGLTREELVRLLEKHDRQKKLGLVWERNQIEADQALNENFVSVVLDEELSDKAAPWRNLVIEGDNFDSLRWLRMTHSRRIKCIYVDPPYNTGSKDWVYNDNFMDKDNRYRFSTWLEFLYRRFEIARDLLTEDGGILVSINDENRALLELMLNEILPGMRVGSFVWRSRTGGNEGGRAFFSENHEHILIYANPAFRFGGTEKSFAMYSNPDNDPRGEWRGDNLTVPVAKDDKRAGNAYYPLRDPQTEIYYPCNPFAVWRYASKSHSGKNSRIKTKYIEDFIANGEILFPKSQRVAFWNDRNDLLIAIDQGDVPRSGAIKFISDLNGDLDFWLGKKVGFGTPQFKRFKSKLRNLKQPLSSWIVPKAEFSVEKPTSNTLLVGTNDEGAKIIKSIFGQKAFNYAKPVSLIKELIRQCSSPGDTVLDFFAGSGTTGQAIMELNAEGDGERYFILASSTEATTAEPDKNLCRDVTAERIRRLNASEDPKFAGLASEFAYLRTRTLPHLHLDLGWSPTEIWHAIEARHGMPLTPYRPEHGFMEHREGLATVIYADKVTDALLSRLRALAEGKPNVIIYCWARLQITERIPDLDFEIRHPIKHFGMRQQ